MPHDTESTFYRYWIAFVASLGGFIQSYVVCIIAGSLIFIANEFQLSPMKQGNVASFILIGAIVGALTAGYLADRIGRRKTLILAASIYFITASTIFYIHSFPYLMVLRFATGIAVGISAIVVPLYLAEIAPTNKRGAFVSCYQFFITIGTLVAYLVNLVIASREDWRLMFFMASIPAALQLLALVFFPDSPRWLLSQGDELGAQEVMQKLGKGQMIKESKVPEEPLFSSRFTFLLILGLVLSSFQQFSGINAVVYFAPKIFSEAGFSDPKDAIFATIIVGIMSVIATFLTVLLIDRFGRKKLLLMSQTGVILALAVLVASFAMQSELIDLIAVGAVPLYVFLYSLGLGPIVWVLISEIFPLPVRAKALALCTFTSLVSNYLVVLSFPNLITSLGSSWTFFIYGAASLIAFLFCIKYVPETKGKSLEQLEKLLAHSSQSTVKKD